jgi:hypothetical protein
MTTAEVLKTPRLACPALVGTHDGDNLKVGHGEPAAQPLEHDEFREVGR